MKRLLSTLTVAAALTASASSTWAQSAQAPNLSYFTGDTRLACEALLCLSSGQRPSECNPSLKKYFSLRKNHRRDKSTEQKRSEFLNMCPAASQDANMVALTNAIVHGAGNCDARTLNATLMRYHRSSRDDDGVAIISNQYPAHCVRYTGHAYTDLGDAPKYVGIPERGGFWAEASEYEAKKAEYDKRIAEEDRIKRENDRDRNGGSYSSGIGTSRGWDRWNSK